MPKSLSVTVGVLAATSADARNGCGLGYHCGPLGGCRFNDGRAAVVFAPGVGRVVIAPGARVCPVDFHLGRYRHFRANDGSAFHSN